MSSSVNVFEAAAVGDIEYLKINKVQLNSVNERGWSSLHFAARFGQKQAVQYLIQSKVDPSIINHEGKTAYEVAVFWGNDDIAELLKVISTKTEELFPSPFPENYTALFSGNPLNRFGWIRTKSEILGRLARSPRSKYIPLLDLQVLYDQAGKLHYLHYQDVSFLVDAVYPANSSLQKDDGIILVFLGIDEREGKGEEGTSLWAIDVTPVGAYQGELKRLTEELTSKEYSFQPTLPGAFKMSTETSALIAQSAAMVDWNKRNRFCPGCGNQTIMDEGGHKRHCTPSHKDKCISQSGIQNFTYPRTDAVVIVCIVHPEGNKILLGRQKRWPKKMFSCVAGFVEAAETLEEAVRREAAEETGIIVDRVAYHSSQPWPFPNSLMLGFIAEAKSTEVHLEDDELEAAQWFDRSEVEAAVNRDTKSILTLPPKGALAYTLITTWLNDKNWQKSSSKI